VQALCLLNGTGVTEPSVHPLSGVVKLMGPVDVCLRRARLDPMNRLRSHTKSDGNVHGSPPLRVQTPSAEGEAFESSQGGGILIVNCECDS
jgi:hypothetical protein